MIRFVLDCSTTMGWCFEDEKDEISQRALESLEEGAAWVPGLWRLEVTNVLLLATRKRRLAVGDAEKFLIMLQDLPIHEEADPKHPNVFAMYALGEKYGLSSYGAAYLELALRRGLPLASRDKALRAAATQARVELF